MASAYGQRSEDGRTVRDRSRRRRDRPGGYYVTFIVEDLIALYPRLVQAGTPVRSDGIVELRAGLRLLLAGDPEGNFVEFLQYEDIAAYRSRRVP